MENLIVNLSSISGVLMAFLLIILCIFKYSEKKNPILKHKNSDIRFKDAKKIKTHKFLI